jgi:predicted GIY-YIG superfamily endonuclease
MGVIYLLHLDTPLSPTSPSRHYIGYTKHVPSRMQAHLAWRGARFMQIARERNIGFSIARTWEGDRHYERKLKNRHNASRMCPICREAYALKRRTMDTQEDLL